MSENGHDENFGQLVHDQILQDNFPVGERELGDGRESDESEVNNLSDGDNNDENEEEDIQDDAANDIAEENDIANSAISCTLPWGVRKERTQLSANLSIENDLRPGEYVMRSLFAQFTIMVEKKIDAILQEPLERNLSKSLQRGEDSTFDQLLSAFGNVSEHCLPSLLRTLFAWYDRQGVAEWGSMDSKYKLDPSKKGSDSWNACYEKEQLAERRDLAVEFIFCLVLIEVLKQFPVHPGHEDLVKHMEDVGFKHFKYREGVQNNLNGANINIIADLYAEVVGVLAQSRFQSIRRRFMSELKDLRAREASAQTTQAIASLLIGMKFFRVKMVPIEDFEASFQFMQECAQYFLEVRDKDIKHALAGLFVEILVPVAATVKNEVNVPCLKNFVEMLYTVTLDMATKSKHRLAIFPLVTCLLCVSQKTFFLSNWHYFLAMCLQHLKNKDPKMSRVALESLFRLLWVYMIRIKCESNSATHSRLASIVNSLFPKGSKAVVPRDTPLNIFVKIIQFIAQDRLDFAMREIVFDLLSVGRSIKIILTPERMSIGLRAFLVVADNLQQKEGDPPMPRTVGVLPSGNTLRVKKTFLSKMLTEDTARNIGIVAYYPLVRKSFNDILKALDGQFGKSLMMSSTQNVNKEPDEMITGERKPKIDLFRTCVAAIPRLIPDGMSGQELVDLLSRLTVHVDEELRALAFQSLQNLVIDFQGWRQEVVYGFIQFIIKDVSDTSPKLLDNGLRMLLQILSAWRSSVSGPINVNLKKDPGGSELDHLSLHRGDMGEVFHLCEGFAFVMVCHCRQAPRRIAVAILKEIKCLSNILIKDTVFKPLIDVLDLNCFSVLSSINSMLPLGEKSALAATPNVDMHWLVERTSSVWTSGYQYDSHTKNSSVQHLVGAEELWASVLVGFLHRDLVLRHCYSTVIQMWSVVYTRMSALYALVDPMLPNENRASLLRGATLVKKSVTERDSYLNLWRNYIVLAARVVPAISKVTAIRCTSPDISVGSSPDSGCGSEKSADKTSVSPQCLYKLLVPLLRCDVADMRDTATLALGKINYLALSDLMEELLPYIKESIERKQENMRRRRRRDALRLQLVKMFEMCAEENTFAYSEAVLDQESGTLQKRYLEYIDGARVFLEGETDKDNTVLQIKTSFCSFIKKLVESFSLEQRQSLLSRNLRKNLFNLFSSWSGVFGTPFGFRSGDTSTDHLSNLELIALQASTAVLCCGPIFDSQLIQEDGSIYKWMNLLFSSNNLKVRTLAEETVVLLLEFNPDTGAVLDWVVDQCYTAIARIADSCFNALATIFSAREYPCDHYTAVMTVTLLNTGCPRASIQETALQLLQILDKRFFGAVSLIVENTSDLPPESSTLDMLLSATYSRSQIYLSKQLAHLHPELTMPIFSEISYRLQTARSCVRQLLFQCMLPWLYNMELVNPAASSSCPNADSQYFCDSNIPTAPQGIRKEGWGSAEATEMVLNNLFYVTVKFGDLNPKEIEEIWSAMSTCWPNNLRVILRYLFIVAAMAPQELLPYAKRVTVYVGRARPDRLVEELMTEMGAVETINCVIERTETPPFFRLTSMRKTSCHGDASAEGVDTNPTISEERGGTLHTKRHSSENKDKQNTEETEPPSSLKSLNSIESGTEAFSTAKSFLNAGLLGTVVHHPPQKKDTLDNFAILKSQATSDETDHYEPHPLPMPEYGGFFSPLTEYLPDSSQPIPAFHRCNLAVMFISEVLVAGVDAECHSVDWSIHIALMLHVITLGLDHSRPLVYQHCKFLLINLLTVIADHRDHLGVARILLNTKTNEFRFELHPHHLFTYSKKFTEENPQDCLDSGSLETRPASEALNARPHSGRSLEYPALSSHVLEQELERAKSSLEKMLTLDDLDGPIEESKSIIGSTGLETSPDLPIIVAETINLPPAGVNMSLSALGGISTTTGNLTSGLSGLPAGNSTFSEPLPSTLEEGGDDTVSNCSGGNAELTVAVDDLQFNIKALIAFILSSKTQPLWNFEDITPKQFFIKSAEQVCNFVRHVVSIFNESLPHAHVEERMAQIALHLALSCSSRHYAGRSLQVFRCLRVSMSPRMLSELLGRLVETVSEQGDDMQGYVTELMLTLESAVEALHSDFRRIEFVRELFKSTPNLNKSRKGPNYSVLTHYYTHSYAPAVSHSYAPAASHAIVPHSGHFRSTSYTMSYVQPESRQRSATDAESRMRNKSGNLARSRSASSLKQFADQTSAEDKLTVLAQLFWIGVSMLESCYEYEFVLALRLLDKVLSRLSLGRPDCRDKVEKLQQQLKWRNFPGVHSLLLKGCTSPTTYEPTINILSKLTQYTSLHVVDSNYGNGFAMNVIALLPTMLYNYEDANDFCIQAAQNIAQECTEKGPELENLSTVMTLYSRRNFSKESFQWTKCVVKYLHDWCPSVTPALMTFLVEVLEKGPSSVQSAILNILHCMLHYIDINATAAHLINGDLMRVVTKYIEGTHWKEALRIVKLAVTRSSSLVVPPTGSQTNWDQQGYTDLETLFRKELPGRTMEFTFDVTQTPVIGRKILNQSTSDATQSIQDSNMFTQANGKEPLSPQRSFSLSLVGEGPQSRSWKRPWLSQARVRERLVNLLNSCGQRVGLPKSPSVIFSQSSEIERQSSMASSTEEVSVGAQDGQQGTTTDELTSEKQFAVFKDFDFLEYELESQEEESIDNFNLWGVRRRSPSPGRDPEPTSHENTNTEGSEVLEKTEGSKAEADWWEEESTSLSEDPSLPHTETSGEGDDPRGSEELEETATPPKLTLDTKCPLNISFSVDSHSDSTDSENDLGDMTPCNESPGISSVMFRPIRDQDPLAEAWQAHFTALMNTKRGGGEPHTTCCLISTVFKHCLNKFCEVLTLGNQFVYGLIEGPAFIRHNEAICALTNFPYVFIDAEIMTSLGLLPKFMATLIALNEHLDTFFDKRENALMCIGALRSTLKLSTPEGIDGIPDDQQIDLCRSVCKLNFQLSLLFDTYVKFIENVTHFSNHSSVSDHSIEVSALRSQLINVADELNLTPPGSPSRMLDTPIASSDQRQMPEGEECDTESTVGENDASVDLEAQAPSPTSDLIFTSTSTNTSDPVPISAQIPVSESAPILDLLVFDSAPISDPSLPVSNPIPISGEPIPGSTPIYSPSETSAPNHPVFGSAPISINIVSYNDNNVIENIVSYCDETSDFASNAVSADSIKDSGVSNQDSGASSVSNQDSCVLSEIYDGFTRSDATETVSRNDETDDKNASFISETDSNETFTNTSPQQVRHQLLQLIADQDWCEALRFARRNAEISRDLALKNSENAPEIFLSDPVTIILNTYCSYLSEKSPGMLAVCGMNETFDEINSKLTDSSMKILSCLRTMEHVNKNKHRRDASIRKTEC